MTHKLKKFKKPRLHHEGNDTLLLSGICLLLLNTLVYMISSDFRWLFDIVLLISAIIYGIILNFFQCPQRHFEGDTKGTIVAPCDGHVVVIEEVEEHDYFHDRRMMVSIFMSLFNVHANWIPCDGTVKLVQHQDGNYHRAWLPKASEENERSMVVITMPDGTEIMARQIAGAVARRIVTYAQAGDQCSIDEQMGFIKFGSRVDLYLPIGTKVLVDMKQKAVGNQTVIARL